MKRTILAAAFLCLAAALPAAAAQGPYVGVAGGLFIPHESDVNVPGVGSADLEYDTGFGFNVAAGMRFDQARVEAEIGWSKADLDKLSGPGGSVDLDGDLTTMSFMVNGYYDVQIPAPVTPFFGAGLGVINGEFEIEGDEGDDTTFGYQFTAGVTTQINPALNLDIYYRYQGASDFEDEGDEISYDSSLVFAGIRYNF